MPKKKNNSELRSINKKLNSINKKIDTIKKEEREIESKEEKIESREANIEKTIFRVGKINLRKKHLYELVRAGAGAFLGVGLGRGLLGLDTLAKTLAWANAVGILIFILGISALLVYRDERENLKTKGSSVITQRLLFMYAISLLIEYISLALFNVQYASFQELVKIMIVGSYTAMASAVTFSLTK